MPEMLSVYSQRWQRRVSRVEKGGTVLFQFKMTSVGCSACIVTVSSVLKGLKEVTDFDASIEKGILQVSCQQGTRPDLILRSLENAGFPMESM